MKVVKSSKISPFGGLNFVLKEFDRIGIDKLLNQQLPALPSQSKYDWKDLFYGFWSVFFCGGDCIEDIGGNFQRYLKMNPFFKVSSPDRILDRMNQLSCKSDTYNTPRGKAEHIFNHNHQVNLLNIKMLKKLSTFKTKGNTLDYDNTLIYHNKSDAKMTYKKQFGYAPGVGLISNQVVYVENRNGNSDAQTLQQDTLQRMFDLLKQENIAIDNFRADSASYQLSTLDVISNNSKRFYVRSRMSAALCNAIQKVDNWEKTRQGEEVVYRGDTSFTPFVTRAKKQKKEHLLKTYRLVITKVKRSDGQINLFTGEPYNYYGILTNDEQKTNDEIVTFYNKRGKAEKEFDVLKNDFNWHKLPFSKIEQNTVFLIFAAICRNLYNHIIDTFSKNVEGLSPFYRIKKFIFRFICVPAKWIKSSRKWQLKLYGEIAFKT